jgi:hypothetical protein
MNPEEYLDRLIERRERCEGPLPVITDAVAVSLAAAEVLVQLREIAVPSEFAGHLELSIRARTLAQQNGRTISIIRPRSPADSPRFPLRRAWMVMLKIAAVLILASAGILWVSAHSLPGDALYGLKQAEHQLTRNLADGQFGGVVVPCYTLTLKRIESNEAEQARTAPQRGHETWNSSLDHPRVLAESLEKAET